MDSQTAQTEFEGLKRNLFLALSDSFSGNGSTKSSNYLSATNRDAAHEFNSETYMRADRNESISFLVPPPPADIQKSIDELELDQELQEVYRQLNHIVGEHVVKPPALIVPIIPSPPSQRRVRIDESHAKPSGDIIRRLVPGHSLSSIDTEWTLLEPSRPASPIRKGNRPESPIKQRPVLSIKRPISPVKFSRATTAATSTRPTTSIILGSTRPPSSRYVTTISRPSTSYSSAFAAESAPSKSPSASYLNSVHLPNSIIGKDSREIKIFKREMKEKSKFDLEDMIDMVDWDTLPKEVEVKEAPATPPRRLPTIPKHFAPTASLSKFAFPISIIRPPSPTKSISIKPHRITADAPPPQKPLQRLPLEHFDDISYETRTPSEWLSLGRTLGLKGTPAFSRYFVPGVRIIPHMLSLIYNSPIHCLI